MLNYYEILNVKPDCTQREIKTAYRDKAKLYHPDVMERSDSETDMRILNEAYEVLSSIEKRREYDRKNHLLFKKYIFDYRTFLKENIDNPENQAKLIFFDLLHCQEDEAIEVYLAAIKDPAWHLGKYFEREDAMDCSFILAEEFENRSKYREAFVLYAYDLTEEQKKPYFKHFAVELLIRIKSLVRLKLLKEANSQYQIHILETMLAFNISEKDNSWYLDKLIPLLVKNGEHQKAHNIVYHMIHSGLKVSNTVLLKLKKSIF